MLKLTMKKGAAILKEIILFLAEIVNLIHDILLFATEKLGFQLTDKDLHFWIMGLLGIFTFFIVYKVFKYLDKLAWSTALFSFIYTFTIMVVIVFAIEIQQAITNRGNMEFIDAAIGLWGFLVFFAVYAILAAGLYLFTVFTKKRKVDTFEEENLAGSSSRKFRSKTYQK